MRTVFTALIVISLLITISNTHDSIRGETTVYAPTRGTGPQHASRTDENSNFSGAMAYNWYLAIGFAVVGVFGLLLLRHYDRFDPFSADFPYSDDEGPIQKRDDLPGEASPRSEQSKRIELAEQGADGNPH